MATNEKNMKTNWTIFFDKGVMKAYETPKKKSFPAIEGKDPLLEAARLSALPVTEPDKVKELIWYQWPKSNPVHVWEKFELDQTKSYSVDAKFREEEDCLRCKDGTPVLKNLQTIPVKVLVLSSNH